MFVKLFFNFFLNKNNQKNHLYFVQNTEDFFNFKRNKMVDFATILWYNITIQKKKENEI